MIATVKPFGKANGQETYLYTISNDILTAEICDFGATLIRLHFDGVNVVCGYDSVDRYILNDSYMGAIVLPNANRIRDARFTLNGQQYNLRVNNGPNNLHSSLPGGSAQSIWKVVNYSETELTLQLDYKDGELGFPGNRSFKVTYAVKGDRLSITYCRISDQDTVFNPTNHSYFNLNGHGTVLNHILQLNCSHTTPNDENSCPVGNIVEVEGTPFDFRYPKAIGRDIDEENQQLAYGKGYDHNWLIDDFDGSLILAGELYSPETGIALQTYTTMPGIQVYTANYLDNDKYHPRDAVCLETQFTPDAINLDNMVKPIIKAGKPAVHITEYRLYKKES
ncbi:MAG: galactose mutarotase [Erysipelotrichaceae bacterium]|nr:galactose mutarotase [Erysipelotrichaceae bacterium]